MLEVHRLVEAVEQTLPAAEYDRRDRDRQLFLAVVLLGVLGVRRAGERLARWVRRALAIILAGLRYGSRSSG